MFLFFNIQSMSCLPSIKKPKTCPRWAIDNFSKPCVRHVKDIGQRHVMLKVQVDKRKQEITKQLLGRTS